jgi:hypothetical protein
VLQPAELAGKRPTDLGEFECIATDRLSCFNKKPCDPKDRSATTRMAAHNSTYTDVTKQNDIDHRTVI